jgi:hypothetical protein
VWRRIDRSSSAMPSPSSRATSTHGDSMSSSCPASPSHGAVSASGFLTQVRGDCLRIGVAFHDQLVDQLPTERHDVAVDLVITD